MSLRGKGIAAGIYIGLEIGLGIGVLIDKRNEHYVNALYWAGAKNVRIEHKLFDRFIWDGPVLDLQEVVKDYKTYNKIIKEIKKKGYSNVDVNKIKLLREIEEYYKIEPYCDITLDELNKRNNIS